MKILIISGTFSPEVGYNEVYIAKKLAEIGHDVFVLTSTVVSQKVRTIVKKKRYSSGFFEMENYRIKRIPALLTIGTIVIPRKSLFKDLKEYNPDIVITTAIAKFLPLFGVFYKTKLDYILISWFADLYRHRKSFMKKIAFKLIKAPWYRLTFRRSDLVLTATPETKEYLMSFISQNNKQSIEKKNMQITLGFDEKKFFFDKELRKKERHSLQLPDSSIILITASKAEPHKRWEVLIKHFKTLRKNKLADKLILIGMDSSNYSQFITEQIYKEKLENDILCYPFQTHSDLNKLFNVADLGIWISPTITIQEGMGTGLQVILEDQPSVNHLVQNGETGWTFTSKNMNEVITTAVNEISKDNEIRKIQKRKKIALFNYNNYSYLKILENVINRIKNKI